MDAKTTKYVKIGLYVTGGIIGVIGVIWGGKKLIQLVAPSEDDKLSGGETKTITLPDGTTVTISAEAAQPATASDLQALADVMRQKWNGKLTATAQANIVKKAKSLKMSRYEVQKLTYLFEKANPAIPNTLGLDTKEQALWTKFLSKLISNG